jgi:hypothetical protein
MKPILFVLFLFLASNCAIFPNNLIFNPNSLLNTNKKPMVGLHNMAQDPNYNSNQGGSNPLNNCNYNQALDMSKFLFGPSGHLVGGIDNAFMRSNLSPASGNWLINADKNQASRSGKAIQGGDFNSIFN